MQSIHKKSNVHPMLFLSMKIVDTTFLYSESSDNFSPDTCFPGHCLLLSLRKNQDDFTVYKLFVNISTLPIPWLAKNTREYTIMCKQ